MINAHGGTLVDLIVSPEMASTIQRESAGWISWDLTADQLCDLELLLNGAFSPLQGFLSKVDYESVCSRMRLNDGTLWPLPIALALPERFASTLQPGQNVSLRDLEGVMIAALCVEDCWKPDLVAEFHSLSDNHEDYESGEWMRLQPNAMYVSGKIQGLRLPPHYDFPDLHMPPQKVRDLLSLSSRAKVTAFCTRGLIHKSHQQSIIRTAKSLNADVIVQALVGTEAGGDVDHYTRVRCLKTVVAKYCREVTALSLLPLNERPWQRRQALLTAIVQQNYGCTDVILDLHGQLTNGAKREATAEEKVVSLIREFGNELGIRIITSEGYEHSGPGKKQLTFVPTLPDHDLSRDVIRMRLERTLPIPDSFTFPEVLEELQLRYPSRSRQGFTVFFTGLSGAGKSTIANILFAKLLQLRHRTVTLLDGDLVRKHLSSELGFSKEHRDINIRRIGYVASEVTKNKGICICAPIAPYDAVRQEVRNMIEQRGGFVLVHVDTPLTVCEERDRKGLYAKARSGVLQHFTGISDPYETPRNADVTIDTSTESAEAAAVQIMEFLENEGYIELEIKQMATQKATGNRP